MESKGLQLVFCHRDWYWCFSCKDYVWYQWIRALVVLFSEGIKWMLVWSGWHWMVMRCRDLEVMLAVFWWHYWMYLGCRFILFCGIIWSICLIIMVFLVVVVGIIWVSIATYLCDFIWSLSWVIYRPIISNGYWLKGWLIYYGWRHCFCFDVLEVGV